MIKSKSFSGRLSVASIISVVGVFFLSSRSFLLTNESNYVRKLSEALQNGGCFVLPAEEVGPDVKPVFAASYPGSGARMTWNLIEALTGLVTGDDWGSNGRIRDVVTIKTHWPHIQGRDLDWSDEIDRAFYLIRNPMNALPSHHNFVYEYENQLENHSTRAPLEEWIKWRDLRFHGELGEWRRHVEYWLDGYAPSDRIVVPYEHLIDEGQGPVVAAELSEFLGRGPGVDPIDKESVPCVWGTVVHYEKGNGVPNSRRPLPKDKKFVGSYPIWPSSHREGSKERPYTKENLEEFVSVLEQLKEKYLDEGGRLIDSLDMYIFDVKATMESSENNEVTEVA